MTDSESVEHRERLATGIGGLDEIVRGGLLSGSVYIIRGAPGAGKTILANQICFHAAHRGEQCLYVTLLSESHDRLIENLRGLDFFSPTLADRILYQSGFHLLEEEGLKGVLRMLVEETKRYGVSLIVLDGLVALHEKVDSERQFRLFLNQVQNLAHLTGCTMLLLTNSARGSGSPEYTMVDGWLELVAQQHAYRVARSLQVLKLRGSGFIEGQHTLTISDSGIQVFPRLENTTSRSSYRSHINDKLSTGIAQFDGMISGGLRRGSNTLVVGPTGVGKTAFGLHFISQSTVEEPGLIFNFYENREDLIEKADALGIGDLRNAIDSGAVHVCWHPPTEHLLDKLAYRLLDVVRQHGAKRLFLDGVNALLQSALHPERTGSFLAALTHMLRDEGVTAMFTLETPELIGGETHISFAAISSIAQNIVLLRYVELESEVQRSISVVKARSSHFDARVRKFTITEHGVQVAQPFGHTDDLLTGHAHRGSPEGTGPDV